MLQRHTSILPSGLPPIFSKSFAEIQRRQAIEIDMLPVDPGKQKWRRRFDDESFHGKLLPYIGIADQIQRRFDEATDNPRHFTKIKWFANYWNRTIEDWNVDGLRYIIGPGLETGDLGFLPK
jgi:hypothetical protein